MRAILIGVVAVAIAACRPAGMPQVPQQADLSRELVRLDRPGPPARPEGACWESDVTPAVIETVTEQILLSPEGTQPDGTRKPATFRTVTSQRMLSERETVWFRTPCPSEMTVEFIATLQRALKARGLYLLPLTGRMDAPTRAAIRRYQAARGLDSDHLSLAAARDLGIVAAEFDR